RPGGEPLVGVVEVVRRQGDLLQVVAALHPVGGLADLLHRRQQEPDQDGDNRDDDQQLNQRKAAALASSLKRKHGCTLSVRRQGAAAGRIVNPSRTVLENRPTVDSLTVTYFVAQLAHD